MFNVNKDRCRSVVIRVRVDNDAGSAVSAVNDAVAAMVATLPVITIKDGEDGFDARVGDED